MVDLRLLKYLGSSLNDFQLSVRGHSGQRVGQPV